MASSKCDQRVLRLALAVERATASAHVRAARAGLRGLLQRRDAAQHVARVERGEAQRPLHLGVVGLEALGLARVALRVVPVLAGPARRATAPAAAASRGRRGQRLAQRAGGRAGSPSWRCRRPRR